MQQNGPQLPEKLTIFQATALLGFLNSDELTIPAGSIDTQTFGKHIERSKTIRKWKEVAEKRGVSAERLRATNRRGDVFLLLLTRFKELFLDNENDLAI